jgi:3-hydroxy-9,10-secoandrosta-1,3,5(10)-triene-9,17-dione monooxygenase
MRNPQTLELVRSLLPGIRERVGEAEKIRRMPDATAAEIRESGLMRLLQPARWGGHEADPRDLYESIMMVASACGSTGWTFGILAVHAWEMALFGDELLEEIWGENPDSWISSSYSPGGELVPVKSGHRLTGRWKFSSGCEHANWAVLGSFIDRGENQHAERFHVVVPRSDYEIRDTWNTVGLRGTGSNDIVIDDVFVPAHRMLAMRSIHEGENMPGHEDNASPLYRMPFASMFINVITAPIIGMAEAMLAEGVTRSKTRVSALGPTLTTDPWTIATLARAASQIEAARVQLLRNIGDLYETVQSGAVITLDQRSRVRRDQVVGSQQALSALDDIFDRIGASAIHLTDPAQRIWRDAHTAQHHAANSSERALFSWTHHSMGLGTTDLLV